jgi:hypothetical protein
MVVSVAKVKYRVRRRDGLPKAMSADEWLSLAKAKDTTTRLGGIAWLDSELVMVARIAGKVQALPFSKLTGDNAFRSKLSAKDRVQYDEWRSRAISGGFDKVIEEKRAEQSVSF